MFIKQLLYRILGVKNYLIVVSRLFFLSYNFGILKRNKTFDCHYFVRHLIQKGDHIIDIGANLGYYSRIFSSLTGSKGKVYCVEPVTLFREVLAVNLKGSKNSTIIPYALGDEDDKPIVMGIPKSNKYLRHGLTRVLNENETGAFEFTFTEKMFTPLTLFGQFERCDYIKCDVEGFEIHIIPQLEFLLKPFTPIIQIEIEARNRTLIFDFLSNYNYQSFSFVGGMLSPVDAKMDVEGDFFFFPEHKLEFIKPFLNNRNN